jgi:hypothetical protein
MRHLLNAFAHWLYRKTVPASLTGSQWSGTQYVDAYKRNREPSPNELMAELKGTAWACASINASVCAAFPPKLYVATRPQQPRPKCATKALDPATAVRLRSAPSLAPWTRDAAVLEEVTEHPLLSLLQRVNPLHNAFDLWLFTRLDLALRPQKKIVEPRQLLLVQRGIPSRTILQLAGRHGVSSVPALLIFKGGRVAAWHVGVTPGAALRAEKVARWKEKTGRGETSFWRVLQRRGRFG